MVSRLSVMGEGVRARRAGCLSICLSVCLVHNYILTSDAG